MFSGWGDSEEDCCNGYGPHDCSCLLNIQVLMDNGRMRNVTIPNNSTDLFAVIMSDISFILGPERTAAAEILVHGNTTMVEGDSPVSVDLENGGFIRVNTLPVSYKILEEKGGNKLQDKVHNNGFEVEPRDVPAGSIVFKVHLAQNDKTVQMAAPPAVALVRLLDELNQEDDFFCNDESERFWFSGEPVEFHATLSGLGVENGDILYWGDGKHIPRWKGSSGPLSTFRLPAGQFDSSRYNRPVSINPFVFMDNCNFMRKDMKRKMLPEINRILQKYEVVLPGMQQTFNDACIEDDTKHYCQVIQNIYSLLSTAQDVLEAKGNNFCNLKSRIDKAAMNLERIFKTFRCKLSYETFPTCWSEDIKVYMGPVRNDRLRKCSSPPVVGFTKVFSNTRMYDIILSYYAFFPDIKKRRYCLPGLEEDLCYNQISEEEDFSDDDKDMMIKTVFEYLEETYSLTRKQIVEQGTFYLAFHVDELSYREHEAAELDKDRDLQTCTCHPPQGDGKIKVSSSSDPNHEGSRQGRKLGPKRGANKTKVPEDKDDIDSLLRFIEGKEEVVEESQREIPSFVDLENLEPLDTESEDEDKYSSTRRDEKFKNIGKKDKLNLQDESEDASDSIKERKAGDRWKMTQLLAELTGVQEQIKAIENKQTKGLKSKHIKNRETTDMTKDKNVKSKIAKDGDMKTKPSKDGDMKTNPSKDGDMKTKPSKDGDKKTKLSKYGDMKTKQYQDGDMKTKPSKDGDMKTKPSKDGDKKTKPSKDGDKKTKSSKDGDMKTKSSKDGDKKTKPSKDGDTKTKSSKDGDMKTRPYKDGDMKTKPYKDGEMKAKPSKDGDMKTKSSKDGDMKTKPSKDGDMKTKPYKSKIGQETKGLSSQNAKKEEMKFKFSLDIGGVD